MTDEIKLIEAYLNKEKADIIKELRSRILENKYEIKPDSIAERILWFGAHTIRMEKQLKR